MSDYDEIPQQVLINLEKDCECCRQCQVIPCDGVMSGGLCDDICDCNDEYEDELDWDDYSG